MINSLKKMMARYLKKPAIPLAGYLYQNLVGIELLYNWLEYPNLYKWVKFEADPDQFIDASGIDDVIALIPTGKYLLQQVKFTVAPSDASYALSWSWLISRKGNGRSLIQKWNDAIQRIGITNISETSLITNRIPDREFQSSLDSTDRRVDPSLLPPKILESLIDQLGEKKKFTNFLEFLHLSTLIKVTYLWKQH